MTKTCPHCHAPVRHIVDADVAGVPLTIHPTPVPRHYALLHIINGGDAVTAESDTTWQQHRTRYYHLNADRIPHPRTATQAHYVTHTCGTTPPSIPPPPAPAHNQEPPY